MLIRTLLLFSFFLVSGCNYFQPATETQCETLYDHIIALSFEKSVNNPNNNGQIENDLMNSFSTTGLNIVLNLTGQKEKILRRCSTTLNQMEVLRCIDTKNKEDWKSDCTFKIE